jgi:hypothetical protein
MLAAGPPIPVIKPDDLFCTYFSKHEQQVLWVFATEQVFFLCHSTVIQREAATLQAELEQEREV